MERRSRDLLELELRAPRVRRNGGGGLFRRLMGKLERAESLDGAVRAISPLAQRLVANGRLRSVLHGDATGLPLHVILTDVPFGAWFMAQYLDLFPDEGSQRAATRLVGLGVVAAAPTALSGWAEWALADRATRRVGIVHAGANGVAVLIFLGSWTARRRGRRRLGVRLARVGGLVLIVGGFLGGYMGSSRRGPRWIDHGR
ncbi:hypothetical protein ASG92_22825 [Arthrobacter sp. Soil736]|uniref:DUF2231 domain-containing protein n=1 Tax=Arthrobacter sp. Soil736 TaxID=1736395 RepID=UPI0007020165|nr:DUF2231 domain-containing protein [Arthrobacter sp. Soil736]KRE59358.1 hypothetical protein ASG92_22825 [Arthrobacter sp. Soil736]